MGAQEKKEIIPPDGVHLGKDWIVGRSIESQAEISAFRIRSELPSKKVDLVVIKKDKAYYQKLPPIFKPVKYLKTNWMPKYKPITGAVYTHRWQEPKTDRKGKGKTLQNPDDYQIVLKPGYRRNLFLDQVPQSWIIAEIVPQEVWGGIEAALQQQDEIRHDYGGTHGVELATVESLLSSTRQLADFFRFSDDIDKNDLERLADETGDYLDHLGFVSVQGELQKSIKELYRRSVKTDALGRVNPTVSRILLRSAYLKLVRREVVTHLSKEKAERIYEVLLIERDRTRELTSNAIEIIDGICEDIDDNRNKLGKNRTITLYRQTLTYFVNRLLRPIKVAPYLLPARIAESFILSPGMMRKKRKIVLEKELEVGNMGLSRDNPSVEQYLMQRNLSGIIDRFRNARSILSSSLKDPDNDVIRVF